MKNTVKKINVLILQMALKSNKWRFSDSKSPNLFGGHAPDTAWIFSHLRCSVCLPQFSHSGATTVISYLLITS